MLRFSGLSCRTNNSKCSQEKSQMQLQLKVEKNNVQETAKGGVSFKIWELKKGTFKST